MDNRFTLMVAADINGFIIDVCEIVERDKGKNAAGEYRGTIDGDRFLKWIKDMLIPVVGNYKKQ